MLRVGGFPVLVVCLLAGVVAAAPPPALLSGRYQASTLGQLDLTVSAAGERVTIKGLYVKGTRCAFTDTEQLLEAELEGTAVVGKLTTCMEGAGCQSPGTLAFLGVVSEGSVTAYLALPKGCSAPGLEGVLRLEQTHESRMSVAKGAIEKGDFALAQVVLQRAAQSDQGRDDAQVLELLGSVNNALKRFGDGRSALLRALDKVGKQPGEQRATILYNLACSEAGLMAADPGAQARALDYLKQALQIGKRGQFAQSLADDTDLDPLRGLPEFQRLTGKKAPR